MGCQVLVSLAELFQLLFAAFLEIDQTGVSGIQRP